MSKTVYPLVGAYVPGEPATVHEVTAERAAVLTGAAHPAFTTDPKHPERIPDPPPIKAAAEPQGPGENPGPLDSQEVAP